MCFLQALEPCRELGDSPGYFKHDHNAHHDLALTELLHLLSQSLFLFCFSTFTQSTLSSVVVASDTLVNQSLSSCRWVKSRSEINGGRRRGRTEP